MELISTFHDRLREAMGDMTATELANILGISKQSVSAYVNGTRKPKRIVAGEIARVLNVNPAWLIGYDVSRYPDVSESDRKYIPPGCIPVPKMHKVPLIGRVACGNPITAEENVEGYVDAPETCRCDFCLICCGDSMIDANIQDGDLVYVRAQPTVENGQIAVVRIGGEATLKRVYISQDCVTLVPANSSYAPITFTGESMRDVHIEGKAIGFMHLFK
jgi:repressor LexA